VEKPFPEVEQLLVELARAYNWIGMYQPGHPSLAGRIEATHRVLAAQVAKEGASGHLLLGIAKDKVLYRDTFLGVGQQLVNRLTEALFLNQVATLDFTPAIDPLALLAFLQALHRLAVDKTGEPLDEILKREGVRGVAVHPYNYKDVLSRRIVSGSEGDESGAGAPATDYARADALWRMLLTENVAEPGATGDPAVEQLVVSPELLPAILKRAYEASDAGLNFTTSSASAETVSPELVQSLLGRIGTMIGKMPDDRKRQVFEYLDRGFETMSDGAGADAVSLEYLFGRALTGDSSDEEFLDMVAAFLSAEEKGGKRLRKIFEVIASERNGSDSLLPKAREKVRESLRTKNYFAKKTWETVESFLLTRSEEAYIGEDHGHLLETISTLGEGRDASQGGHAADPVHLAAFTDDGLHRKATAILLELLTDDCPEDEYLGILEDIRKTIPNLVSRKEFELLDATLAMLAAIGSEAPPERAAAVRGIIGEIDFAHVVDVYLEPGLPHGAREAIRRILLAFAGEAVGALLDRLLVEGSKVNRRTLLELCAHLAPVAVPAICAQLGDPRWFFVRNLCLILGEIGDPGAAREVVLLLEHDEPRVRREAIMALGKMKAQDAVTALGRILLAESLLPSAREDSLRIDVANAIFRIGGTRAASYLHRGTDSRRQIVKSHCATLLKTMRPTT
jgi:hypothetical protein